MGKIKQIISLSLVAALILTSSSIAFAAEETATGTVVMPQADSTYSSDEIIVVYKEGASSTNIRHYVKKSNALETETTALDDTQQMSVMKIDDDQSIEEALMEYAESPIVDYVQPNYLYRLPSKVSTSGTETQLSSADKTWHLENINLSGAKYRYNAFASEKTVSETLVVVLDTGVDIDHEDLQMCLSKELSKKVTKDNELINLTGDSDIFDGHGTHVFGIIGATANNQLGGKGVASSVLGEKLKIASVDIFNFYDDDPEVGDGNGVNDYDEYGADTAAIVKGLDYAREINADVINLSLGSYYEDHAEKTAIQRCIDDGILVVAAAGNEGTAYTCYPSDYEGVLSVIASNKNSEAADWSNYGKTKDITAPGEAIYSTIPSTLTKYSLTTGANKGETYETEKYALMDGTSMAAPVATGVAAILCAVAPTSSLTRIQNAICKTAKDIGPSGKDAFTGYGLLNAGKAVQYILAPSTPTGYTAKLSTNSNTTSTNYRRVALSWNKMLRATGYRIAYKAVGAKSYTYKDVSASQNSVTLKLEAGKKYQFKVRGYRTVGGVRNYGAYTSLKYVTTLKAPTLNKITKTNAGYTKLKWSNINGESGYQVYKRKGKTGKWYTVKWKNAGYVSFTDKNVNKKYTYYYKVRAYKKVTVNGVTKKVYGPWSVVRSK